MNRLTVTRIFSVFAICLSLLISSPPKSALAQSTTITFNVNSTDDRVDANPGDGVCATKRPIRCTLRAATMEASATVHTGNNQDDTLVFIYLQPTTYTLTLKDTNNIGIPLKATRNTNVLLIIETIGGVATIEGGSGWNNRILQTLEFTGEGNGGAFHLENAIIQNGNTTGFTGPTAAGGGVYGNGIFKNVTFRNNRSNYGGGAIAANNLTLLDCVISKNSTEGNGGGILIEATVYGELIIENSWVSDNSANFGGGVYVKGLQNGAILMQMQSSTISKNIASRDGGGIYYEGFFDPTFPTGRIWNSTISGNTAGMNGGGIHLLSGHFNLSSVTVAFNTADSNSDRIGDGGGLFISTSNAHLDSHNSMFAQNSDLSVPLNRKLPECSGTIESLGYNLLFSTQGCTFTGSLTGNILNQSPNLLPLDFYLGNDVTQTPPQGLTPTHAYPPGSLGAGVDDGNPAGCIGTTAQNGVSRHLAATGGGGPGNCDIGAFELVGPDL